MKRTIKNIIFLLTVILCTCHGVIRNVSASESGLASVTGESQICPVGDGTGALLLKSDGYYCLNADGTLENKAAIHYFSHVRIDGIMFNGYYYHDETGKFTAQNEHLMNMNSMECNDLVFSGIYLVQNLGKLTSAPKVRYVDTAVDTTVLNGYYYFDAMGKMASKPAIHYLQMECNGILFDGTYYFGNEDGSLTLAAGTDYNGYITDENGKISDEQISAMTLLNAELETLIADYPGTVSVYVKNLNTLESLEINEQPLNSASVIKTFVMAFTYENYAAVAQNVAARLNVPVDNDSVAARIGTLLTNMITVSDNESFNELVRLQTGSYSFVDGAKLINEYLAEEGYKDTSVQNVLSPSSSADEGLGGTNTTSVMDCADILERIFKGQCVSTEASAEMLNLLKAQATTYKIPAGLPAGVVTASKSGENDDCQHDIAIVYGPETTYILCVMSTGFESENAAIDRIRNISSLVYNELNP